ncbi:MAG: FAD-binding oxidoreductase [Bacteroidia bacterium]
MQTIKLAVQSIIRETPDAIAIYFRDDKTEISHFWPGQFLTLVLQVDGKSVRRSYSICTAPSALPMIGICVKRVEGGLVSNHLLDNLKEGDVLEVLEPYGSFTMNYKMPQLPTLVLIGAGSGITPLMSILKSALDRQNPAKVHLFYGNRNENSIIFKEQLQKLEAKYAGNLEVTHLLSRAGEGYTGIRSRIEGKIMQALCNEKGLFADETANFYVCGPDGMMHDVLNLLESQQIPKERIHKESFFLAHKAEPDANLSPEIAEEISHSHKVRLKLDGTVHELEVEPGKYILETALEAGLDLPYACTMGVCGMCRAVKVEGEMLIEEQEAISESEIEEGACLTCVGKPLSQNLFIDYDAR